MEIAIPILTLGGLYIISNNKNENDEKNNEKEGFSNNLPNTNVPTTNFPTTKYNKTVNDFTNPNAPVDQYFQSSVYENVENKEGNNYQSLTGDKVNKNDFTHNNMQPFFGSTVKQRTYNLEGNETLLDNMQGSGSQMISKKEQAPLFKPSDNMHWTHGTPNHSSFIQSRMNPSRNMSNVKPWDEIRVGPGLNDGFNCESKGGFNAALESRDEWKPRTVDELRTTNNPKNTYSGVTLGGKHFNNQRGIEGKMEKNRPERYFAQNCDRYLTTTGAQIKQSARGEQVLGFSNRVDTTSEYYGTGGRVGDEATYVVGEYREPHRMPLDADVEHLRNAHARSKHDPTDGDHGVQSYDILPNERTFTGERSFLGAVSTIAKEMILPLQDFLRPSRKENVIGNLRPTGNAKPSVGQLQAPAEHQKTTKKEMMVENDFLFNVGAQDLGGYGYTTNDHQMAHTQRATTGNISNLPGSGGNGAIQLNQSYIGNYNSKINDNKETTLTGRTNMGNQKVFNNYQNISIGRDDVQCNNHVQHPHSVNKVSGNIDTYGLYTNKTPKGQTINCERMTSDMVDNLRTNPYSHPIGSIA